MIPRIKYEGCPVPLYADKSFWEATKEEIDAVAGGCGPGKYLDYLIPDTVWFLSIERACRIHDYDYSIGTEKAVADERFYVNMQRIVLFSTKWRWLRSLRLNRIKLYYLTVRHCGDSAYAADKNNKEVNLL